ncbi:3782_t:CDS:1 [Acaulospora colombiana]|uniref:3782_t:CDS:1 n=1 Tax=Acaulospora colombiana TaxID=27376 RepID=A0ACA9Q3F4_9GLOM|nr:3782_t:CDS:1 [Acaulospora colombiana]
MSETHGITTKLEKFHIERETSESQWETLRQQLQDEIIQLSRSKKNQERLRKIKASYNETMDMLRDIETGMRMDPLEILPNEINTAIMLNISSVDEGWYTSKDLDILSPLLLVSKRWQSFVISEPLLWNYIEISSDSSARRVTRPLELSGIYP